jgi:hypothetical protein
MSLATIDPLTLIVIVGVVLAIGVSLWMHAKCKHKKRTRTLHSRFGPEFDKAITAARGSSTNRDCWRRQSSVNVKPSSALSL